MGIEIEGLSDEQKAQVEALIASSYVAKDDFVAVKAKADELLGETKKAKEAARAAAEAAAEESRQKAIAKGDVEGITKSFMVEKEALVGQITAMQTQVKQEKIGALAAKFVGEKFVRDAVIQEAIAAKYQQRLDLRDGKLVVLAVDGTLSSLSVQDLENEFLKNGAYKAHIIATNAAGGGASGSNGSGTGGANLSLAKAKTIAERTAAIKQKLNTN